MKGLSSTRFGRRHLFRRYFLTNRWDDPETPSGRGSSLAATENLRQMLPQWFERYQITSLLDVPCGDGHWMREVPHNLESYTGADIVVELVSTLTARARPGEHYLCLDAITDSLPYADAVISRDFFIHLSDDHVRAALKNMQRSGARFLIASTYPEQINIKISTGLFRPINLAAAPFDLGPPLELVEEGSTEAGGRFADKSVALWSLQDLKF